MENKLKFSDFKNPKDLISKIVLRTTGSINSPFLYLVKITKVTKTGFRVEGTESLYGLDDGKQKGGSGGRASFGSVNKCELVTDEEINQLKKQWKEMKIKKDFYSTLELIINSRNLSLDQITQISNILNNEENKQTTETA